jgi:hypothetical protein
MPLPATLNYVNKEYASIREELLKQVSIITKGRYTNLNESDPGIALIELYMSMVDNMLFYQDMMIQELYLSTARQRRNVINLVRLIGYEFRGASAATGNVSVNVTPGTYPVYPVTVSKGTQFAATSLTTNQQVLFTTTAPAVLSSASDVKTLPVSQGTAAQDTFTSDGSLSFKIKLTSSTVEKTSIIVKVDSSNTGYALAPTWTQVDSFYEAVSTSTVYKVEVDEYSQISIIFGNGSFGQSPALNTKIYVDYIITLGSIGNVGPNSITTVVSGYPLIYDRAGKQAQITVKSSTATSGGQDTETIEEAKEAAVGQLFSQKRALTRDDFKFLTEAIGNVDKAISWGEAEEKAPDYRLMNLVRLTFFSQQFADMYYNPVSLSSYKSLRDNLVKPTLLSKMPITTKLSFVDPVIVDIFMWVQIGVNTAIYDPTIVADNVKTAISTTFSFDNVSFGQDIRLSDIYKVASSIDGVSWVKINRLHTTPSKINSDAYANTTLVDTAPVPPVDIILENWKLPTVVDVSINPNFTAVSAPATSPYLEISLPESFNIGINDITVSNPDLQSDIDANSFTYYPSSDINHIVVTYSDAYNGPSGPGGFYSLPSGMNDSYIFTSSN